MSTCDVGRITVTVDGGGGEGAGRGARKRPRHDAVPAPTSSSTIAATTRTAYRGRFDAGLASDFASDGLTISCCVIDSHTPISPLPRPREDLRVASLCRGHSSRRSLWKASQRALESGGERAGTGSGSQSWRARGTASGSSRTEHLPTEGLRKAARKLVPQSSTSRRTTLSTVRRGAVSYTHLTLPTILRV